MKINFTDAKTEAINDKYHELRKNKTQSCLVGQMGLQVVSTPYGGAVIHSNNEKICSFVNLGDLIDELLDLKKAIEEETGLLI